MPKSKQRKNHKQKVNNRRVEMESQKNRVRKYQEKYFEEVKVQYEKQLELKRVSEAAESLSADKDSVIVGIDDTNNGVDI